jgi:hypothetical protein
MFLILPSAGGISQAMRMARKADERKVRLAARIRPETTLSLDWIAEPLAMGSWTTFPTCSGKAKGKVEKVRPDLHELTNKELANKVQL